MLVIRELQENDIPSMVKAFEAVGWEKPASQYRGYIAEQSSGLRNVLLAFEDEIFAGYLTILWESHYPPFKAENIPEISDFIVMPQKRRRGIGSKLIAAAEKAISRRSKIAG